MSKPIITVENLSKRYQLGTIGATSLRESVERGWHKLRGRDWRHHMDTVGSRSPRGTQRAQEEDEAPSTKHQEQAPNELWALRDVSFEVKRGEVLGVIGRNGAGKSTLLKLLTRITEPTSGRVTMRGRVASLLEVGTGFHPELTGRENVYLNGAISGMKRSEITRKFDEIVAFSEVDKFIDTPVKRYSSGMYVRLAFAVAAHLEPEILLVDEVLAVGDFAFQKKCLGKMGDVAAGGRTVLFVSHNMSAVSSLCQRGVLLDRGCLTCCDAVEAVIERYMTSDIHSDTGLSEWPVASAPGDENIRLLRVSVVQSGGVRSGSVSMDKPFDVEITLQVMKPLVDVNVSLQISRVDGVMAVHSANLRDRGLVASTAGEKVLRCRVPARLLNSGMYFLSVGADIPHVRLVFHEQRFASLHVQSSSSWEMSRYPSSSFVGVVSPLLPEWLRAEEEA